MPDRDFKSNAQRSVGPCVRLGCFAALLLALPGDLWAQAGHAAALARVRADEARRVAAFDACARSVVCIFGDRQRGSGGSGVIIDEEGFGLTNFHVVAPFLDSRRGYGGLADGRLYPLTVLGIDPGGDIAMFKLEGRDRFEPATLGDSDELRVGQWVAAMGNPFLLAEDFTPTITLGVISGLHRYQHGQGDAGNLLEYADCIQVSTSINPGNSGGPLFDLQGRVIGINGRASFEERGRVNVGLGYAVSMNQVRRFVPALRAGNLCAHGTLGATVRGAGDELIFDALQTLSPAERAGIRLGDEVLYVAGRRVRTENEYNNALAILPENWPVRIVCRRSGELASVTARLERLPLALERPYVPDPALNQAEVLRRFARFRQWALGAADPLHAVRWTGRLLIAGGGDEPAVDVSVHQEIGGLLTIESNGVRVTSAPGEAIEQPDVAPPLWRDPAFWDEWRLVTTPLLTAPAVDFDWELLGGDEAAGRLVAVVQRQLDDGRRLRWKFDTEDGSLVEATLDRGEEDAGVRWNVDYDRAGASNCWPHVWQREVDGRLSLRVIVDSFDPIPDPARVAEGVQ